MSDPAQPAEQPETGKEPEFEGEFDPDKAKRAIANLRAEVASLKGERDDARKEVADFKAAAEQTGEERDKALSAAVERAEKAERALAIKKHNLPDDVVEEFADYLTGSAEEVEQKAARLAARLAPKAEEPSGSGGEKDDEAGNPKPALPSKPKPDLVPGSASEDTEVDFDAAAIAAASRR